MNGNSVDILYPSGQRDNWTFGFGGFYAEVQRGDGIPVRTGTNIPYVVDYLPDGVMTLDGCPETIVFAQGAPGCLAAGYGGAVTTSDTRRIELRNAQNQVLRVLTPEEAFDSARPTFELYKAYYESHGFIVTRTGDWSATGGPGGPVTTLPPVIIDDPLPPVIIEEAGVSQYLPYAVGAVVLYLLWKG